jgi:hypothetical protein
MQKRKYIFIALSLGLVLVFLAAAYFYASYVNYVKYQERFAQRHHLLCEILKPGMSKGEVLNILEQAGEFSAIGAESTWPNHEMHIAFTDPTGRELYGAFELSFFDYKYNGAYIRGFDNYDAICDFSQAVTPAAATPKP